MPVAMWLEVAVVPGLSRGALLQLLLVLPTLTIAGAQFFVGAARALAHRAATMDTLVAVGAGSAALYSFCSIAIALAAPAYPAYLVFDTAAMARDRSFAGTPQETQRGMHRDRERGSQR
jgi:cation transport ATPase